MIHTISVIGLGYIGLPTAVLLASRGKRVIGVDIKEHAVTAVNAGSAHLVEPELDDALRDVVQKGLLSATTILEPADVFLIAVPTPVTEGHTPNLRYIETVARNLAPVLAKGNLVILESTSPVGTTEQLARWLAEARPDLTFPHEAGDEADIHIAYCPERVLPGRILQELVENDRVIGGMSPKSSQLAEIFYRIFVAGSLTCTDSRTAELCKLVENSFRDVNIAFANELSLICDTLGIDVWNLITCANLHPRVNILQPGTGVGGHCIAVDPWFVVHSAPEAARLIRTAREVNTHKPEWVLKKIRSAAERTLEAMPDKTMADVTVACLGLAFKPDIDDLRESPALSITREVANFDCQVLVVEPYIDTLPASLSARNIRLCSLEEAIARADVAAVLVKHSRFAEAATDGLARHAKLIDAVGLLSGMR